MHFEWERAADSEEQAAGENMGEQFAMLNWAQAMDRVGGDAGLLREIAALFLDDAPDMMEKVREAIGRRDPDALERAAHSVKGCVATFGAAPAVEAARELELAGRSRNLSEIGPALARLEAALQKLTPELSLVAKP